MYRAAGVGEIMAGFEDLEVWQEAHKLAVEVYKLARQFPTDERFRYTDQICRASTSIPTNVAEGTGRYGKTGFQALPLHRSWISRGDQIPLAARPGLGLCSPRGLRSSA